MSKEGSHCPSCGGTIYGGSCRNNKCVASPLYGGPPACFPAGTKIMTPWGEKNIEIICVGDSILSIDVVKEKFSARKVLKVNEYKRCSIGIISFIDGSIQRTTGHHSFWTGKTWKMARRFEKGDRVGYWDGKKMNYRTVEFFKNTTEVEPVYNIITEYHHTFIADGSVAHNFTNFRYAQSVWWRAKGILKNINGVKLPYSGSALLN